MLDLLCFCNIFRYYIPNLGIEIHEFNDSVIMMAKPRLSRRIMNTIELNAAS